MRYKNYGMQWKLYTSIFYLLLLNFGYTMGYILSKLWDALKMCEIRFTPIHVNSIMIIVNNKVIQDY